MGGVRDWLHSRLGLSRRRYKRYQVVDGAYAFIGPYANPGERIKILDISGGGLAFMYAFQGEEIPEFGLINIGAENEVYLRDVPYATITDEELNTLGEDMAEMRRRGVQFRRIKDVNKARLKAFIRDKTREA